MIPIMSGFFDTILPILFRQENSKALQIKQYFERYRNGTGNNYMKNHADASLIRKTEDSISTLRKNVSTNTLESDVYYMYLFAMLNGTTKRIWATSIMGEEEWIDTPEEEEFLRLNLEAATRKVLVERIFIASESGLGKIITCPPVLTQISKRNDYLKLYIINEEELQTKRPTLLKDIGSGFLAFSDFAVAIDVFEDKYIRGILSLDEGTIDRYSRIFTNLRDFARPLDELFLNSITNRQPIKSSKRGELKALGRDDPTLGGKNSNDYNRVFISYAHKDREWLLKLQTHLKVLENLGISINAWDDTRIKPGMRWQTEIKKSVLNCKVSILLVSTDFLASKYIKDNELPPLLQAAQQGGATILPLILQPCLYTNHNDLSMFQAVNDPSKPLSKMAQSEQEEVFITLTKRIAELLGQPIS